VATWSADKPRKLVKLTLGGTRCFPRGCKTNVTNFGQHTAIEINHHEIADNLFRHSRLGVSGDFDEKKIGRRCADERDFQQAIGQLFRLHNFGRQRPAGLDWCSHASQAQQFLAMVLQQPFTASVFVVAHGAFWRLSTSRQDECT
jgi:hypothetical protein